MSEPALYFTAFLIGYVFGSIPFGLLLTRLAGMGDVRKIGSGNIGATNVLRTGNKPLAAATLALDMAKGALPVILIAQSAPEAVPLTAVGAFIGHLHPVWLGFKGGKGVAVFLGIMLGINLYIGLACCATWLLSAAIFRYSSLAAMTAAVLAPVYAWAISNMETAILALAFAIIILLRHRDNIARLQQGTEPKIGGKKSGDDPPDEGST
ncbi:MAG: glycerol-3-phosphate 1-O-acyltransferase PlsY [Alphaproteobacteria bacterium]|nr:glycerol-3-phosphate 1-O-acyltransferase PlsY [Alphaproteobacteria bacterium]